MLNPTPFHTLARMIENMAQPGLPQPRRPLDADVGEHLVDEADSSEARIQRNATPAATHEVTTGTKIAGAVDVDAGNPVVEQAREDQREHDLQRHVAEHVDDRILHHLPEAGILREGDVVLKPTNPGGW